MKSNDFLANLLQIIGFLAAIIIAISQYFFSGNFKFLFSNNEQLYSLANIVSLVLGLAIIVGLYSIRYMIDLRNYFNKNARDSYWKELQEANQSGKNNKIISEPRYWTISQLGFLLLVISLISFGLLLIVTEYHVKALLYVFFICLSIASLSIFSLKIYLIQEFKNTEDRVRSKTLDKINAYFVGNLKIVTEYVNKTNLLYPVRTIVVEYNSQNYLFKSDANDPDKFFTVELVQGGKNGQQVPNN